jgi:hypothetical protein
MPIDGGLVVGYLTAAVIGAGKRWGDKKLDQLLDRLTGLVAGRMGRQPLDQLRSDPQNPTVQRDLGLTLDGATRVDPTFAQQLAEVVAALDQRGGREMVNTVYANMNVQAFDHGIAVGGNFNYFHAPDPSDISDAPAWVKLCIVLGSVLALGGMFIFGYTLFTDMPDLGDPDFGETPPGIPLAFGVFFAGFVVLGIASLGRALSKRR